MLFDVWMKFSGKNLNAFEISIKGYMRLRCRKLFNDSGKDIKIKSILILVFNVFFCKLTNIRNGS